MDAAPSNRTTRRVDAIILSNPEETEGSLVMDGLNKLGVSFIAEAPSQRTSGIAEVPDSFDRSSVIVVVLGEAGWGSQQLALARAAVDDMKKTIIPAYLGSPPAKTLDTVTSLFGSARPFQIASFEDVQLLADEIMRNRQSGSPQSSTVTASEQTSASGSGAEENSLAVMLRGLGITQNTPAAHKLLSLAASLGSPDGEIHEISSTSLLVAVSQFQEAPVAASAVDDTVGVQALNATLANFGEFDALRADYIKVRTSIIKGGADPGFTDNVGDVLRRALTWSGDGGANSVLTTSGLIAGLLSQPNTKMEERLMRHQMPIKDFRSNFLAELSGRVDEAEFARWRRFLGVEAPVNNEQQPAARPGAASAIAHMGNDNPEREKLDDKLGVKAEARAFARIAAAKQVSPPLAFGVFGDWGSGKSFFMNLMHEDIDSLANKDKKAPDRHLFHRNIVQIRFNAWHYVDSNLWASLVDHIFLELDRWVLARLKPDAQNTLFDKLATARDLTLESAERLVLRRKDQKEAAEQLAKAKQEFAFAEEKVGQTPKIFWTVVREQFLASGIEQDLKKTAGTLGIDQVADDAEKLKGALTDLQTEGRRAKVIMGGLRKKLSSMPYLSLAFIAIVVVPPLLIVGREHLKVAITGNAFWEPLVAHINETALALGGVFVALAGIVKTAAGTVREAIAKLESYRGKLDEAIAGQLKVPAANVKDAQDGLAKQSAKVVEAEALLTTTTDRLAAAVSEYAGGSGRGRLLNFVRERVADGHYAKHLGLVTTARRDFTELSALMKKPDAKVLEASKREQKAYADRVDALLANAKAQGGLLTEADEQVLSNSKVQLGKVDGPTFERIVLYIDDLDRCPPATVVEVLQAVHLLLTFPLFVVIVAVDVRWVSRSLRTHYDKLLHDGGTATPVDGIATPRDYLEKIFQVPYWVRPMTGEGSRALLTVLATNPPALTPDPEDSQDVATPAPVRNPVATLRPNDAGATAGAALSDGTTAAGGARDKAEPSEQVVPSAGATAKPEELGTADAPVPSQALVLTEAERAFLAAIAPNVGRTPRRALRFVNVYRVIKASLEGDDLSELVGGGYRALMVQLAVTTGASDVQKNWCAFVDAARPNTSVQSLINELEAAAWFKSSPEGPQLRQALALFASPELNSLATGATTIAEDSEAVAKAIRGGVVLLQNYGKLARRYSFGD